MRKTNIPACDDDPEIVSNLVALGSRWRTQLPHGLRERVEQVVSDASYVGPSPQPDRPVHARIGQFAFGTAIVVAVLVVLFPIRGVVARPFQRVLEAIHVGKHTDIVREDARTAGEVATAVGEHDRGRALGRLWSVHTPYGGFTGNVPEGKSPALLQLETLDAVRAQTHMRVLVPNLSYRGTATVFHHALLAPDGFLLMFIGEGSRELLLVEAPLGAGRGMQYSRVISGAGPDGKMVLESPPLRTETYVLNGQNVTWDPDTTGLQPNTSALRWEADGVSYSVMGRALTREEAEQIFLSLTPLS